METETLTWEELRSQICAVDEVLDKLSKVNRKHAELTRKYQAALNHIRNLERKEFDSNRLLTRYKASFVTVEEHQALKVELEASKIELSAQQDEHKNFVNTAQLRYQSTCQKYIDQIEALKAEQQKTGKKQPQGGKNAKPQKLQEMYAEVCAKYVKMKGHSCKLESQNVSLTSEVNTLKEKLQERDDEILRLQLENSVANIQAEEEREKEIEFLKQPGSLRADKQEEWSANATEIQENNGDELSPVGSDVDEDLFNEAINANKSVALLSPFPPSPHRFRNNMVPHGEDLVEVTFDGSLQSQSDCVFSSPAPVNQELQFLDKISMHTQTEEFTTYSTAMTQTTLGMACVASTQTTSGTYCPASTQTTRKNAALRVNQHSGKIIRVRNSLQKKKVNSGGTNNFTVTNSVFYLDKTGDLLLFKKSEKAKEDSSPNTETVNVEAIRGAPLRVNQRSGKIIRVRNSLRSNKVNCGSRNYFNITNSVFYSDETGIETESFKKSEKAKEDSSTNTETVNVEAIENNEEVDLIRELVEPRSVDSGYTKTDTDGDNDSVILVDMPSEQESASTAGNESRSTKAKPTVPACFAKRKRESRKRKVKCGICKSVDALESDGEHSTTSSRADDHDSPKIQNFELNKASSKKRDREKSVQCESDTENNWQIGEQMSVVSANEKGNLNSGFLDPVDLCIPKNELSMQSSMVNMMTNNHNNSYNDCSMSKQCTTVSRPYVIADRNEKLIKSISPIPNQKAREPLVSQEEPNRCNISDSSLSSSTAEARIQTENESTAANQSQLSRDNFDLTTPLCLEVTDTGSNNRRLVDKQEVIEISDTSFQSQSAKANRRCRKLSKKDLAAGMTLGFKDSDCVVTKSGTRNTAAQKSPLVKMATNTSEKSNVSLLRTPVSKKRGAIIKKKLENVSVMTTRSATRKARMVNVHIPSMQCTTCSPDVAENLKAYEAVMDMLQKTENSKTKSVEKDHNETSTRIALKHTVTSKSASCEMKMVEQTHELSKSRNSVIVSPCSRLDDIQFENKDVGRIQALNQEWPKSSFRYNGVDVADNKEEDCTNRSSNIFRIIKTAADQKEALAMAPRLSCRIRERQLESNSKKQQLSKRMKSSNSRNINSPSSKLSPHNRSSALVQTRSDSIKQHPGKQMMSPNGRDVDLPSLDLPPHKKLPSALGQLESDLKKQHFGKRMKSPNGRETNLSSLESSLHNTVSSLEQLASDSIKQPPDKRMMSPNGRDVDLPSLDSPPHSKSSSALGQLESDLKKQCFGRRMKSPNGRDADLSSPEPSSSAWNQLESDSKKRCFGRRMKSPNGRDADLPSPEPSSSALKQLESDSKKQCFSKRMKSPNGRNADLSSPEPSPSALKHLESDLKKQCFVRIIKSPNGRDADLASPELSSSALKQLESDSKKQCFVRIMKSPNGRDADLPSPEPSSAALKQLESDSKKQCFGRRMKSPNGRDADLSSPEPSSSALKQLESDSKKQCFGRKMMSPNGRDAVLPSPDPSSSALKQLESDSKKQCFGRRMKSPNGRDADLPNPEPSSSALKQLENDSKKQCFGRRMKSPNGRDADLSSPEPSSSAFRQLESDSKKQCFGRRMKSPNGRDADLSSPEPSSSALKQLESDSKKQCFGRRMKSPNGRDADLSSPEPSSSALKQLESDSKKQCFGKRMKSPNGRDADLSSPEPSSSSLKQLESDSKKQCFGRRMKSPNGRDADLSSPEPSSSPLKQLESDSKKQCFGKRMKSPNGRDADLSSPDPLSCALKQLESDSKKQCFGRRMKSPNGRDADLSSPEPSSSAFRQLESDLKKQCFGRRMKSPNGRDADLSSPEPSSSSLKQLECDSKKQCFGRRMKSPNGRDADLPNPEPSSSALKQLENDSKKQCFGRRMKSPNGRDADLSSPEPSSSAFRQLESDSKKQCFGRRMKSPNGRDADLSSPEPSSSALKQLESDSKKQCFGRRMKSPNGRDADLSSPEPSSSALKQLESDSKKQCFGRRMKSPNGRDADLSSPEPSSSALKQLESDSKKQCFGRRMKSPNGRDADLSSPEPSSSALKQLENDSKKQCFGRRMKSPNGRDADLSSPEPSSSAFRQLESDSKKQCFGRRMKSPNGRDADLSSPEPSSSALKQLESDSKKQCFGRRMKSPNGRDADLSSPEPSSSALKQLESDSKKQCFGKRMKSPNGRDADLSSPEPSSSSLKQLESDSKKQCFGRRMKSPNGRDADLSSPEPSSSALKQLESDSKKQFFDKRMKSPNGRDADLSSPEPSSSSLKQLESDSKKQCFGRRMKSPNLRDSELPVQNKWSSLGSPRQSSRINVVENNITAEQILNRQKAAEKIASSLVNDGTQRTSFKRPLCKRRSVPLQSPGSPEPPEMEAVEAVAPKIIPLEPISEEVVVSSERTRPEEKHTVQKLSQMSYGQGKRLLQQMIQFPENENIETTVRSFSGQAPAFIIKLVLEAAQTDQREELAKRKVSFEPILTITQQALLKLMVALDSLDDGQVCKMFLDTADVLLPTIINPAGLAPVTRLYVAICKLNLDMWRIRRALCNSFASMGDLAVPFMYIILQSWLEVMPLKGSDLKESLFAKAIVQLVLLRNSGYQHAHLRQLLKCYYEYSVEPLDSKELLVELFKQCIVEGNECLETLALALSNSLDKKWVFDQIDAKIKPHVGNFDQICTVIKLVGSITKYHCRTLDSSVIKSNRQWLKTFCNESFPDCIVDAARSALKMLIKCKV